MSRLPDWPLFRSPCFRLKVAADSCQVLILWCKETQVVFWRLILLQWCFGIGPFVLLIFLYRLLVGFCRNQKDSILTNDWFQTYIDGPNLNQLCLTAPPLPLWPWIKSTGGSWLEPHLFARLSWCRYFVKWRSELDILKVDKTYFAIAAWNATQKLSSLRLDI